jgi:hypothetical protein
VLLLETGIGPQRVDRALDWLFSVPRVQDMPYRPTLAVFAGFAGSLSSWFRVGDVLLANEVVDPAGRTFPTTWPTSFYLPCVPGRLLTTPHLVADPAQKRALGSQHQAEAVDMESARFAERCQCQGISFGCVRAISDNHDAALAPELASLLEQGVVSPWRFALALLRRPGLVREMARLARDTREAAHILDQALMVLLRHAAGAGGG